MEIDGFNRRAIGERRERLVFVPLQLERDAGVPENVLNPTIGFHSFAKRAQLPGEILRNPVERISFQPLRKCVLQSPKASV